MLKNEKRNFNLKGEIYLKVKAIPNSSLTELRERMADDTIKISLKAIPEKNKANKELVRFLASFFDIPKENVIIISGKTERIKLIKISNENK